ncbi:MAG: inorganic diphosphatase [Ignavibacteriales bacterium]
MSGLLKNKSLLNLPAFDQGTGDLNAIIETPRNSRNKYKYEPEIDLFKLDGILQSGAVFPFDFGFIPSTVGGDQDPLDILILMEQPVFTGCLVPSRIIGVIEAEQKSKNKVERNDRLIAVFSRSHSYSDINNLQQLNKNILNEIEYFFITYNRIKGKEFKPVGRYGSRHAIKIVREGVKNFKKLNSPRIDLME